MPLTAETALKTAHEALQALLREPGNPRAQAEAQEAAALCERYWEALDEDLDAFYAERIDADFAGAREWDCAVGGGV